MSAGSTTGVVAPGVTVGVVAYRRPEAVGAALEPLAGTSFDVVVANVDRDPAVAELARAHGARVLDLDNRGYAAAVNALARAARGTVVVFTNDDVRITPADVARLAAVVAGGEADVAVPRIVDSRGRDERTIQAVPGLGALAREWLLLPDRPVGGLERRLRVEKWRAPEGPEVVGAATAAVVAVRRDLLLDEPLPEAYFLYWEESEWFWRLRARGAVVQYRPDAVGVHDGGRDDVRPAKSRLLARNAVRCIRRTHGRVAAALAVPLVVAWNLRLLLADAVRAVVAPGTLRRGRLRARVAGLAAACASWGELR